MLVYASLFAQKDAFIEALSETITTDMSVIHEAVSESQFTMIGEAHGLAEVQTFSSDLFIQACTSGYDIFVVETDPYCAAKVEQLAKAPLDETDKFAAQFPMAIPFFHSVEGMEMARRIAQAGGEFWGVDQVFIVGPRYLFNKLVRTAPNERAKTLAEDYEIRAREAFTHAMASGAPDQVLMMQLTEEDYDKLREAFAQSPSAIDLLYNMALSQQIYQYWYDGEYYNNNSVRSDLMKELFLEKYNARDEKPNVMFKLGSYHAMRGLTGTNIYDLGNTVNELAAIEGTNSVHIKLSAAKGTSFNMLAGVQEFNDAEDWHPWLQEALSTHLASTEDGYVIVDLRKLRNLRVQYDPELKELIFPWDFWVIIPEASSVTPLSN